jgi:cysteine desulfurase
MGVEPALARAALRISLGWETNESDLDLCLNAWKQVVSSLGRERGGRAA